MAEKQRQIEFTHKVYTADTLKNINDAVVKAIGGSQMKKRFYDLIADSTKKTTNESSKEIIERISNKLRNMGN